MNSFVHHFRTPVARITWNNHLKHYSTIVEIESNTDKSFSRLFPIVVDIPKVKIVKCTRQSHQVNKTLKF